MIKNIVLVLFLVYAAPGYYWFLSVGILIATFKSVGLMTVIGAQLLLVGFSVYYWDRKGGLSKFMKIIVGVILVATSIALAVGGWGFYIIGRLLAPVVSTCFYLLLIKLVFKLAHSINLLIVSKQFERR